MSTLSGIKTSKKIRDFIALEAFALLFYSRCSRLVVE